MASDKTNSTINAWTYRTSRFRFVIFLLFVFALNELLSATCFETVSGKISLTSSFVAGKFRTAPVFMVAHGIRKKERLLKPNHIQNQCVDKFDDAPSTLPYSLHQSKRKSFNLGQKSNKSNSSKNVPVFSNVPSAKVANVNESTTISSAASSVKHRSSKTNNNLASETPKSNGSYQQLKSIPSLKTTTSKSGMKGATIGTFQPWEADYRTSRRSQDIIKNSVLVSSAGPSLKRAMSVLEAFLHIPSEQCNSANVVCALTLSAKMLNRESNEQLRVLLFRVTDILPHLLQENKLSARQLCNVAWAIAKHYDRDALLLPSSAIVALSEEGVFGHAETWDLREDLAGSPALRLDRTIDTIAVQLTKILSNNYYEAKGSELCMASWAFGILRRRRRPAGWQFGPQLGKVTAESGSNVKSHSSDHIKFEQWGIDMGQMPKLSDNPSSSESSQVSSSTGFLFDKIAEALCVQLKTAEASNHNTTVFEPVIRVSSCQWSELANLAWAFASHGQSNSVASQNLLVAIGMEASRRLQSITPEYSVLSRDIAQIMWSLGTLQVDNFRLTDIFIQFTTAVTSYLCLEAAEPRNSPLRGWSCADLVQVGSSLAHARLDEMTLLRTLYADALMRLDESFLKLAVHGDSQRRGRSIFLVWEISVLLWAQARLYLKQSDDSVFTDFTNKAVVAVHQALQTHTSFEKIGLGAQEQANIAWSITVLEHYTPESLDLLNDIFLEAARSCKKTGVIQLEHAHQMWQALCLAEDCNPGFGNEVPGWFRQYLENKWLSEKSRVKISSARHKALSKTLDLMGVSHLNEHDEDIDVAIILKPSASWTHEVNEFNEDSSGHKIAVEFDGPNHFTRQPIPKDGSKPGPPRALGHNVLKYKLLKKQGWTVVRVPYYEFDKIPFWASMERQRYLQRLLKTHGNLRFSNTDASKYKPQPPIRQSRFD